MYTLAYTIFIYQRWMPVFTPKTTTTITKKKKNENQHPLTLPKTHHTLHIKRLIDHPTSYCTVQHKNPSPKNKTRTKNNESDHSENCVKSTSMSPQVQY